MKGRGENNTQEPADNRDSGTPGRLYTMMVMVLSCIIVVDNSIVAAWLLCPRSCFVTRSPDHDSQRHHQRRHHCQLMDLLDWLTCLLSHHLFILFFTTATVHYFVIQYSYVYHPFSLLQILLGHHSNRPPSSPDIAKIIKSLVESRE